MNWYFFDKILKKDDLLIVGDTILQLYTETKTPYKRMG